MKTKISLQPMGGAGTDSEVIINISVNQTEFEAIKGALEYYLNDKCKFYPHPNTVNNIYDSFSLIKLK
jgi:hypothetical protein